MANNLADKAREHRIIADPRNPSKHDIFESLAEGKPLSFVVDGNVVLSHMVVWSLRANDSRRQCWMIGLQQSSRRKWKSWFGTYYIEPSDEGQQGGHLAEGGW